MHRLAILVLLVGCAASEPRAQRTTPPPPAAVAHTATFSVVVLEPDGAPCAGASVDMRGVLLTTDASGRASLQSDWDYATARVEVSGYLLAEVAVSPGVEATLRLRRAASIAGRVVTTSGAPVAGAVVRPSPAGEQIVDSRWQRRVRAVSDADGRFEILGLAEGQTYDVHAATTGLSGTSTGMTAPRKDATITVSPAPR